MLEIDLVIFKDGLTGEKAGWTYLVLESKYAGELNKGSKKSFRVKGSIDNLKIKQLALMPIGEGDYVLPLNAQMRKTIKKKEGQKVSVKLELDLDEWQIDEDFMNCLENEKEALNFYENLPKGHQRYFSNWIASAKSIETKSKRIIMAIKSLSKRNGFSEMINENKK
jgi:hypothetical protein